MKVHVSGDSLLINYWSDSSPDGWPAKSCNIIGDILTGIVGAFIGSWLLPQLGIHLGLGIVAAIINATIGALVLLLIFPRLLNYIVAIFLIVSGSWASGWFDDTNLKSGDGKSRLTILQQFRLLVLISPKGVVIEYTHLKTPA